MSDADAPVQRRRERPRELPESWIASEWMPTCSGELEVDERAELAEDLEHHARMVDELWQQGCTGYAASWCPLCGDCSCRRWQDGERDGSRWGCPLHGERSDHGTQGGA